MFIQNSRVIEFVHTNFNLYIFASELKQKKFDIGVKCQSVFNGNMFSALCKKIKHKN